MHGQVDRIDTQFGEVCLVALVLVALFQLNAWLIASVYSE
jgi:hypothetical protein